ncbi:EamA family transporter [Verminephrobacter aporrectodeae subsp. tuberculatae]|uniref:EamA family transporter n=1 Tax=Verminephrobacter aporrectodeae subsp. tuberculatae TaxID=1110392 RepID=A0ABT3KQ02_9BURK|nr:DMT family transporter [Verminephrobacter aporrectodeae]MCW5220628.1 EamA family transporter [Verminephrobacter aporrectodeae subsp. tuberculatae]MCW5289923.1 EamA family transporter [Verminephrobacter aporrectodeae subsp. tuberculatae]MCW5320402.1 EamA family transporter [Verminephrobacter aporrectodeae subsp. tuberculatae]
MWRTPSSKTALASGFVILCWAYSPIGIRIGLQSYEPGHLALLRFLIASAFMGLVAGVHRIALPRTRDLPLLVALGFFAVALHHVALNHGQRSVSAGAASVLAQSTPIFSALIARCFLNEKITLWRWGCVALGLAGAVTVIAGDRVFGGFQARGLLVLLAAFAWSVYFVLQKRHAGRYSALTMVCYTVWSGTALLCIYLPGLAGEVARAPMRVNAAVLLLGVLPSALAYLAWAYVLSRIDVSRASMALYLVPPTAMLMASMVLGEKTSPMVLLGAAIVIASVVALNFERRGEPLPSRRP